MFDAGGYLYEFNYLNHVQQLRILFYAAIIFCLTIIFSIRLNIPIFIGLFIAMLKSMVFFIYFYFYYDSSFHFYDDILYFSQTRDKLMGYGIFEYFFNIDSVKEAIGTNHIGYWTINFIAQKIFGSYYY